MTANRQLDVTAALAGLAGVVPVPLLDTYLENRVRRHVTRGLLKKRNVKLSSADIATLSDTAPRSVRHVVFSLLTWPVKKVFRTVVIAWDIKRALATRKDVVRRAALLEEALEYGLLPGDAAAVRGRFDAV